MKCGDCGREFKSQSALTQHTNREHGQDPAAKLRAKFGDVAPRPGGAWKPDRPLRAAPSGIPAVDYAIGIGGVPRGTVIEVFGPPKAGKTFQALTFSAHAQQNGGKAGFCDAERALQPTFLELIPDIDVDRLEYSQPRWGEEALEITKEFIKTGDYAVWTVDSVHACVPKALADVEIGSPAARAALARLLSEAVPVIEHIVADTSTVCVFVNHIKTKPGVQFGRDWYVPGGSALEYYSSVRLHVWASTAYFDKTTKRQIGHKVKVKVEKSKVAAPYATAEYDLFYASGHAVSQNDKVGRAVVPGVDIASCWLSILKEEGRVHWAGSGYVDLESGEALGTEADTLTALQNGAGGSLLDAAHKIVYPARYRD